MKQDMIVTLDLGSIENIKLVRDIRKMGVHSEIYPHDITASELKELPNVKGVIINNGSNSAVGGISIDMRSKLYEAGYPVMAAGYGVAACERSIHSWDEVDSAQILRSFVSDTCRAQTSWNMKNFIFNQVGLTRQQVGNRKALSTLSDSVDSSVMAVLFIKAIGKQLACIHVNHGFMRKGESESIIDVFKDQMDADLVYVDAVDRFLRKLVGVADSEQKHRTIGAGFIRVFREKARKLEGIELPTQGTVYPDTVESGTKTIKIVKSHHSVGGLSKDLNFALVEPLRQLFEDEVRACGLGLGLPHSMVYRQPFPGPGLGVRYLGAITRERLEAVRESDAISREEFANAGLDKTVWQYFTIVPDFRSVGVRNSTRCFDYPVTICTANTVDTMIAFIECIDYDVLQKITDRILKGVKNVNRVCYDLSPKPMATIKWKWLEQSCKAFIFNGSVAPPPQNCTSIAFFYSTTL